MPRGGARPGAGVKSTWKSGKTRTIRVPIALVDAILAFARELDERDGIMESVTNSKVINLFGISIRHQNGATAIYLEDLVKAGYEILPESLSNSVKERMQKLCVDKSSNITSKLAKTAKIGMRYESKERPTNRVTL